ncbi:MAG: hypothetical protein IJD22_05590 [Clostridia bacterium]|nr:hypothetical protein [Clostridia bacterium]
MKLIKITAALLAVLMLLCSCAKDKEDKESETTTDSDIVEPTAPEDLDIDFSTVKVSSYAYGYINGAESHVSTGAGTYKSAKPSIATVDENGRIIPVSPGVTLVGYVQDGEQRAIAVCIFAEGASQDRASGHSAELVEVGKTYMHTAPVGGAQYTSSNDSVVSVAAAPQLSFVSSGYACITCSTASRPFSYSFIVYDRAVE